MTTDELIDLGHKAGTLFVTQFGVASVTVEWLENFAALVAAAEREACAKVCDGVHARHIAEHGDYIDETYATECAAAIRARGTL